MMHIGLNAHLLSSRAGYRSAGIHGYIDGLLRHLPREGWRFTAFVGAANTMQIDGIDMRRARLDETGVDALVRSDVDFTEGAADLGGERLALFGLEIEDRDLDALGGKRARGGGTKAGGPAGDDGGGG